MRKLFWALGIAGIPFSFIFAESDLVSLQQALAIAAANNPSYQIARRTIETYENKRILTRAGFMPTISSDISYKRATANSPTGPWVSSQTSSLMSGGKEDWESFNNYSLSLTVNQTIWDFKTYYYYQSNALWRDAATAEAATNANNLYLSVIQNYFAVVAADANARAAESVVAQMERRLETARTQVQNGVRTPVEALRAEAELASARLNLVKAENARRTTRKALATVLGLDPATDIAVDSDATVADPPTEEVGEAVVRALRESPDCRALREKIAAARMNARGARGDFYPQFKATAGVTYTGYEFDAMEYNWYVGASLSWNLFAGLATDTQVRDADNTVAIHEISLRNVEQNIRYEVENAYLALREARERAAPARALYDAAKSALALAEERFAQGVGTTTEITDAQASFNQATATLIQARTDLETAKARVRKALGIGYRDITANGGL